MSADTTAMDREVEQAVAFVLRSTRQAPQTSAELADKLRARNVDEDVGRAALARARELGAVDDAAFAQAWVADRGRGRGYGRLRLRRELVRRRVPEALIDEALDGLGEVDEEAVAERLAARRFATLPASLPPETAARRLAGFLSRRGYPPGLSERIAIRVTRLDESWD